MSLIEQKKTFMDTLQCLLDARSAEIDSKVAEFRASLEKEKLTDEMKQLVAFINQLDAMIAFEKQLSVTPNKHIEDVVKDDYDEDVTKEKLFKDDENVDKDNAFSENDIKNEQKETNITEDDSNAIVNVNDLVGTGFEALQADADDTKAKLKAVEQARPGMHSIVLPRR